MDANDRRARATEEATQWWTRLGTEAPAGVSETERQEFTRWLRESPLHVAELLQVAHVHDALERFKLWGEVPLKTQPEGNNVAALPAPYRVAGEGPGSKGPRRGGRRTGFLLAASAAIIAIGAGWLGLRSNAATIETNRAERREVVLADGSVVNLEPETAFRVDIGKQQRYVVLTRGRALFHVAKDSTRPFIVHTGEANVRAVGTVFGVERKNQDTIVTVSEGKVAVVPTDGAAQGAEYPRATQEPPSATAGTFFLTADQQITVQKSGDATPIQKVDSSRALAWSEGRLVFDSTPLSEVADEFNRYNQVQLHINDPDLARRTISGVFRATDPETLLDFIGAGAHVVVTRQGNEKIVISASR